MQKKIIVIGGTPALTGCQVLIMQNSVITIQKSCNIVLEDVTNSLSKLANQFEEMPIYLGSVETCLKTVKRRNLTYQRQQEKLARRFYKK